MIFVTIGTARPFDRLVAAADRLALREPVLVQCGDTSLIPLHARTVSFLSYEEVARRMREARVVVSHAGAGSVVTALLNGRRPIVVPRRHALSEAVDDHQLDFARHLAGIGLVRLVLDPADLVAAIDEPDLPPLEPRAGDTSLAAELQDYLSTAVAR